MAKVLELRHYLGTGLFVPEGKLIRFGPARDYPEVEFFSEKHIETELKDIREGKYASDPDDEKSRREYWNYRKGCPKGSFIFLHGETGRDPYHGDYRPRPIHVHQSCEDIHDMLDPRHAFAKRPALGEVNPAIIVRDLLDD